MPRYLCFEPPNEYFECYADNLEEAKDHARSYGAGVLCVIESTVVNGETQTTVVNGERTVKNDEVAS